MVAVPIEGSWKVRALAARDAARISAFLENDPVQNVFVASKIADEGLGTTTPFVELQQSGETVLVASVGSNVVMAVDPRCTERTRETALALLAETIVNGYHPVRAIIAAADLVEGLWHRLHTRVDPPTVVRLNQPVYLLEGDGRSLPDLAQMRYATAADLDLLVPACAAMHLEEVGIDPLARDAVAYRHRIRELIARHRALLHTTSGRIAFKCEFSAVTSGIVQLMGVWTAPSLRRLGYAKSGMEEVCGHLLRQGKSVTLFVNDFNRPARALYESIGFRQVGTNRALIW